MTEFIKPRLRSEPGYDQGHLICQTGDLAVKFKFEGLDQGIVKLIEQFGSRLYYGYPRKDIFLFHWYSHKRYQLVQSLNHFNRPEFPQNNHDDLGLYLHMSRIAQTQKWKYPSFITRLPNGQIDQTTGGTRAFAIGLTKTEPWKHFPILMSERVDKDINQFLDDPIYIQSDQQLTEILGGSYDEKIWAPTIMLTVEIKNNHPGTNAHYCLLNHVAAFGYGNNDVYHGQQYLEKFKEWKIKNPSRPKLNVYTNYPECVKDINGIWDWKIVGDTGTFEAQMGDKVGWVENKVRNYHNNDRTHNNEYVCWLIKKRKVDLGDLLPWMDLDHTTFITDDYSFALYQPVPVFNTTFISMSYQF